MTNRPASQKSEFFSAGGALSATDPSYVQRAADDELFALASQGRFAYVLTSRQMGKTSLLHRTAKRLNEVGIVTARIDISPTNGAESAEQWYLAMVATLNRQLCLSTNADTWWRDHEALDATQRFIEFLRSVVLQEVQARIVIFIDEIDSTLRLDFSDNFFIAIRYLYNFRDAEPNFTRLSFVLLGAASPTDLIKDTTRTPFNIAEGVALYDFTPDESAILRKGLEDALPGQGERIFQRIYYWTKGHPYLTQMLCSLVVRTKQQQWGKADIDSLVQKNFLAESARGEVNLKFVQEQILRQPDRGQLLALYGKILKRWKIEDDAHSTVQNQLKLSGLVKVEDRCLVVRNPIYKQVFDLKWVRINNPTPINWTRIVAVVSTLVALLASGIIAFNFLVETWKSKAVDDFTQHESALNRVHDLAEIFRLQGIFISSDYEDQARNLFFSLDGHKQLDLFDKGPLPKLADLLSVIRGLYTDLANVDGKVDTTPVLNSMYDKLSQYAVDKADNEDWSDRMDRWIWRRNTNAEYQMLKEGLGYWVKGRKSSQAGNYRDAINKYDRAVLTNTNNPSILYDRAKVLIKLGRYADALHDLDRVIGIAKLAPTPSPVPTETPTPLPTATSVPLLVVTPTVMSPAAITPAATIQEPKNNPTPEEGTKAIASPTNLVTQPPSVQPALTATPMPIKTPSLIKTVTVTPTSTPTLTATPIPTPNSITSAFTNMSQRVNAVRDLINLNSDLAAELIKTANQYPNLVELNLVPIPTNIANAPSPTPQNFPKPTRTVSEPTATSQRSIPFGPVAAGSNSYRYIYKIRAACSSGFGNTTLRQLTGFKLANIDGILTALHGVVGCNFIRINNVNGQVAEGIIKSVNIEKDLALLIPKLGGFFEESRLGFELSPYGTEQFPSHINATKTSGSILGYANDIQEPVQASASDFALTTLRNAVSATTQNEFKARKSPDLSIRIYRFSSVTMSGMGGGPILDDGERVVGIVIGGEPTDSSLRWGIPLTSTNIFQQFTSASDVSISPILQALAAEPLSLDSQRIQPTPQPTTPSIEPVLPNKGLCPPRIDTILKRHKIIVGVRYDTPPFGYEQEGLNLDHQLARAVARKFWEIVQQDPNLIKTYTRDGLKPEPATDNNGDGLELKPISAADRIKVLKNCEVDMVIATMTHTKDRERDVDFSQTYFVDQQSILARKVYSGTQINSITDLIDKPTGYIAGATGYQSYVPYLYQNLHTEDQRSGKDITKLLQPYNTYMETIPPLLDGKIAALTGNHAILEGIRALLLERGEKGDDWHFVDMQNAPTQPYAIGLPQGDSNFRTLVNYILQRLASSGEYSKIFDRVLKTAPFEIDVLPGDWRMPDVKSSAPVAQSVIDEIKATGMITVGVRDEAPLMAYYENGQETIDQHKCLGGLKGFEIELVKEFARRWLGDPTRICFMRVDSTTRFSDVANGKLNFAAAIASRTNDRESVRGINFSQTYFEETQSILVPANSGIETLADLKSTVIGVVRGSNVINELEKFITTQNYHKDDFKINNTSAQNYSELFALLDNGNIGAVASDRTLLAGWLKNNNRKLNYLFVVSQFAPKQQYGFILPSGDDEFRDLVNFTLQAMQQDGTYAQIYEKAIQEYFGVNYRGTEFSQWIPQPYAIELWPGPSYFVGNLAPMVKLQDENNRPFYMDTFEVTNQLYSACVARQGIFDKACQELAEIGSLTDSSYYYAPEHQNGPVVNVDFFKANSYCDGVGKSLPTETQWKIAAQSIFANTNTIQCTYSGTPKNVGVTPEDSGGPDGVKDLICNAMEWITLDDTDYDPTHGKLCVEGHIQECKSDPDCTCPIRGVSPLPKDAEKTVAKEPDSVNVQGIDTLATEVFSTNGFRCVYNGDNPPQSSLEILESK